MSIPTNQAHVYSALQFSQNTDLYFELAHPDAWSDDSNPDSEDPSATDIGTAIGFKQADQVLLVYDGGVTTETTDTTGYIVYGGHKWITSSSSDAYTNNAHYVLLTATIAATDLPAFTYRQLGIRKGTTFASSITGTVASAANVTNKGVLWFYENKTPRNHTTDAKLVLKYVISC